MSGRKQHKSAEVVSLEEFRRKVDSSNQSETLRSSLQYKPLDYLAYMGISRVLRMIRGKGNAGSLSVIYRMVDGQPSNVTASQDRKGGWYYALDASRDELEATILDLEVAEEDVQKSLKAPITRMYFSTLVARHTLEREKRLRPNINVSNPKIDRHEIRLENDLERWKDITFWRAAAGLGLFAVGQKRPPLRDQVESYLQTVLVDRHNYAVNLERIGMVFGKAPDDRLDVEEFLLGFCNPLKVFEAKQVVTSSIYPEI